MLARLPEIFDLHICDDCMFPTLPRGDLAIIDRRRRKIFDGAVYAIRAGSVIQVRRVTFLSEWLVRVLCDNTLYPAYETNLDQLHVVGKVIYSSRIWS
jgi:phage repressor protein C with HTH and peptisase S24 domain